MPAYNRNIDKQMAHKLVWLCKTSNKVGAPNCSLAIVNLQYNFAVASVSRLAMLVTRDHAHVIIKLSSVFDCGF